MYFIIFQRVSMFQLTASLLQNLSIFFGRLRYIEIDRLPKAINPRNVSDKPQAFCCGHYIIC